MDVLYTATATSTGGRDGHVATSDGNLDLDVTLPKGFNGPETPGTTNPEQLFAAGYAACFHSAVKLVANKREIDVAESTVTANVDIGATPGGRIGLQVELVVDVPGVEPEVARKLVDRAHSVCPYSYATRGNIDVKLSVVQEG